MSIDWPLFFPPDTHVLALPSWRRPRIYLPARTAMQRWEQSAFYPASRLSARLYRLVLRASAVAGLKEVRKAPSDGWPLGDFVRNTLPQVDSVVVLVGTAGPAQKVTAQLWDEKGKVLAYLKYAEKTAARRRLRQESLVLSGLPSERGPRLTAFGRIGNGEALLETALSGKSLPATLPPAEDLVDFSMSLVVSPPVPLEAHPWVRRIRSYNAPRLDTWFRYLSDSSWPVVVQHGDFAPWNLIRRPEGKLAAIDWEYGALEGFPYLDVAYYMLQTSALMYRWTPLKAAEYSAKYLARHPRLMLGSIEAQVLTRLAAYEAYRKSLEDGQPLNTNLQLWRRAIWESAL